MTAHVKPRSRWVRRPWLLRVASALIGMAVVAATVELTFWVLPVREESPRLLPDGDNRLARFRPNERWRYSAGWNFYILNDVRTNNAGWVSNIDYFRDADTPLVAFVGDSFVEADQLPWSDTCHGVLASRLEGEIRVYSFAMNGSPLSQYVAYADHVREAYHASGLVIPIIENDFDQSFRQYQRTRWASIYFAFEEEDDRELRLVPPEEPSEPPASLLRRLRRWVNQNFEVLRYRTYHVRETGLRAAEERRRNDPGAAGTSGFPFIGTDPATLHTERVTASRRAVDAFLRMLPERSGLEPAHIVFVAHGIRPHRYTNGWQYRWEGSYHDVMRRYFMDEARADGFEVIDMQPVFADHYRAHRQPFNWLQDLHWNPLGHGLCAEQVARSRMLQQLQPGSAAFETE